MQKGDDFRGCCSTRPRSPDDWLYVQLERGKKFKAMEAQTGVYHYGYANGPADALALCGLLHQQISQQVRGLLWFKFKDRQRYGVELVGRTQSQRTRRAGHCRILKPGNVDRTGRVLILSPGETRPCSVAVLTSHQQKQSGRWPVFSDPALASVVIPRVAPAMLVAIYSHT